MNHLDQSVRKPRWRLCPGLQHLKINLHAFVYNAAAAPLPATATATATACCCVAAIRANELPQPRVLQQLVSYLL